MLLPSWHLDETETAMEPASTLDDAEIDPVPATPLPPPGSNLSERSPLPQAPLPVESAAESVAVAEPEPEPVAEPVVAQAPTPEPAPAIAVPTPAPEPAPVAPAQDTVERGAPWLLRQDPQAFTLQLYTLSSKAGVERLIGEQQDPGQFSWYSFTRSGKELYVVLYGVYTSRAAANAASVAVGTRLGVKEPWVRRLGSIQDGIRSRT